MNFQNLDEVVRATDGELVAFGHPQLSEPVRGVIVNQYLEVENPSEVLGAEAGGYVIEASVGLIAGSVDANGVGVGRVAGFYPVSVWGEPKAKAKEEQEEETDDDLGVLSKSELVDLAKDLGEPVRGSKTDLIERITEARALLS